MNVASPADPMYLQVAVDTPLRRLFDYRVPEDAVPAPGCRVLVPFGRRQLCGMVVGSTSQSELPPEKLKPIARVIDPTPVLDAALLALLRWTAEYYHHPLGEVIAAALPKLARGGAPARVVREVWALTADGSAALAQQLPKRAPKQLALLRCLAAQPGATAAQLDQAVPDWRGAARILQRRNWIASADDSLGAPPPAAIAAPIELVSSAGPTLLPEQTAAVSSIEAALHEFRAFLLNGITGSGKTEVYLQVVERALARGRRALVLVPEIGLTPQLVARFEARFNTPITLLHSGLTDSQRLTAWRDAHSGLARIVLGTRSGVFAPIPDLGVIVVDEEHDSSYKQQEGSLRYSARDLAVVRAQMLRIPVVLGSATPSLESLQNLRLGRYTELTLPRRTAHAQPPTLKLVDLRQESVHGGLSTTAVAAIEQHLAADSQVLVYINRRGYAPTLLCTACGWIAPCLECDARMTVHRAAAQLRCHHCGATRPLPRECPQCGFALKTVGQGTERIEETLAGMFAAHPIARLDRDVARRQQDLEAVFDRVSSGAARILVGTQMVTKGHDFPGVTLVVVLNADQGLFSTDFRAAERLAQTIVQVAGRAGRGTRAGTVMIQTEYPEHPLLVSLLAEGYPGFARTALAEREAAQWPPFSRLAALRASGTRADDALGFLAAARAAAQKTPRVRLLGPTPAAMARRAGRHHAQLLVESPDRSALHRFIAAWLPQVEALPAARRVRWALDVDPLELF